LIQDNSEIHVIFIYSVCYKPNSKQNVRDSVSPEVLPITSKHPLKSEWKNEISIAWTCALWIFLISVVGYSGRAGQVREECVKVQL
jgi:hypothetical protein